jgi:hypothetical protein
LVGRFIHNEYLQVTVGLGPTDGELLLVVIDATARAVRLGRASAGVRWAGVVAR